VVLQFSKSTTSAGTSLVHCLDVLLFFIKRDTFVYKYVDTKFYYKAKIHSLALQVSPERRIVTIIYMIPCMFYHVARTCVSDVYTNSINNNTTIIKVAELLLAVIRITTTMGY